MDPSCLVSTVQVDTGGVMFSCHALGPFVPTKHCQPEDGWLPLWLQDTHLQRTASMSKRSNHLKLFLEHDFTVLKGLHSHQPTVRLYWHIVKLINCIIQLWTIKKMTAFTNNQVESLLLHTIDFRSYNPAPKPQTTCMYATIQKH